MLKMQENFTAAMRLLKIISGKTLSELSKELGVSRSTLQDYISGRGNPNMSTVDYISANAGVDPSFFINSSFTEHQLQVLLKLFEIFNMLPHLSKPGRLLAASLFQQLIEVCFGGEFDE